MPASAPLNTTVPAFDATPMKKDFSPTGLKFEGPWENDRNAVYSEMWKDIIREAFGVQDVICGHHLVYVATYQDAQGFPITVVEEIPSADTLVFNHDVMKKLFGLSYLNVLAVLAREPVETRDAKLAALYYSPRR